jgi:excisionase family DNA binding protein
MSEQAKDQLLRPNEAAEMLGISRGTLYNWAYQRRIPAVKMGHSLRFSRLDLERYIEQHKRPVL